MNKIYTKINNKNIFAHSLYVIFRGTKSIRITKNTVLNANESNPEKYNKICDIENKAKINVNDHIEKYKSRAIKPYKSIPGPRGPFGLGNIFKYLPLIGKYSWLKLHHSSYDKYNCYGSIVKETMVPGEDIIWLYDPKDIATLLNTKTYPLRRSHLALAHYRSKRPNIYKSAGLLAT